MHHFNLWICFKRFNRFRPLRNLDRLNNDETSILIGCSIFLIILFLVYFFNNYISVIIISCNLSIIVIFLIKAVLKLNGDSSIELTMNWFKIIVVYVDHLRGGTTRDCPSLWRWWRTCHRTIDVMFIDNPSCFFTIILCSLNRNWFSLWHEESIDHFH